MGPRGLPGEVRHPFPAHYRFRVTLLFCSLKRNARVSEFGTLKAYFLVYQSGENANKPGTKFLQIFNAGLIFTCVSKF